MSELRRRKLGNSFQIFAFTVAIGLSLITFSASKDLLGSWQNSIPKIKDKATVGDIDQYSSKIKDGFQWNCEDILTDHSRTYNAVPSAVPVGILASIFFDDWIIEKPYALEPDYIAPFEIRSSE